jgi:hypothetical protein
MARNGRVSPDPPSTCIPRLYRCATHRSRSKSGRQRLQENNLSTSLAGQAVGIKEVHDDIWLVSFMDYDLGYFDLETRVLEPLENPFGPKVLPMS